MILRKNSFYCQDVAMGGIATALLYTSNQALSLSSTFTGRLIVTAGIIGTCVQLILRSFADLYNKQEITRKRIFVLGCGVMGGIAFGTFAFPSDAFSSYAAFVKYAKPFLYASFAVTLLSSLGMLAVKTFQKTSQPIQEPQSLEAQTAELNRILFELIFTKDTLESIKKLGDKVEAINQKLATFNSRNHTNLECRATQLHDYQNDPWQTIKIIDKAVTDVNTTSPVLKQFLNAFLTSKGLCSNDGVCVDDPSYKPSEKHLPMCFIHQNGQKMFPQIQLSRMDIKKIVFTETEYSCDDYMNEIKSGYSFSSIT